MGSSLIVARTNVGQCYLEKAIEGGALDASRVDPDLLPRSQSNLLRTRGEVWGRMMGARLVGARTPTYHRLPNYRLWLSAVPMERKLRSILGSMRRCIRQKIAFKSII
jgi:coenzyme F420 hydrogenase subunit beta